MRGKLGMLLILCGLVLIGGAVGILLYNHSIDTQAGDQSAQYLSELVSQIQHQPPEEGSDLLLDDIPQRPLTEEECVMREVVIGGRPYIGYLSIPALELELPILSQWSYDYLSVAPCRYSGTMKGQDLVLLAHNYSQHFGRLTELVAGDRILFTDMDGAVWEYQVVLEETLDANAVEEMTAGEYDLTLFTCTYNGERRIALRCDRIPE